MKITTSNVADIPVGAFIVAFNPLDDDPAVLGRFVRTNVVVSDNQEFLYVTVQDEQDGSHEVFDLNEMSAYVENDHE